MASRESRFTTIKSSSKEIPALPVLRGETSIYANPVDTYLSGKSETTKRMVSSHMNKVAVLFDYESYEHTPWSAFRYEHLQTLIGVLQQQKYAHTTINAIISAVRGTVRAAMGMNLMTADDYQRLMLVKMVSGVRLPTGRMMSKGEIKALVEACLSDYLNVKSKNGTNSLKRSPAAYRDLAIFGLMYIGGLRRSEVADLNTEDIDFELKEARVIGKGNKERMLFLDGGTVTAVKQWLALRGKHDGALFYRVLKNGKIQAGRLSDQAIYNVVKKRQIEAGIAKISPHDFRKTFISTILEETGDLRIAQALAGHSDPKTTANYDRREIKEMRKAASSLHFPLVTIKPASKQTMFSASMNNASTLKFSALDIRRRFNGFFKVQPAYDTKFDAANILWLDDTTLNKIQLELRQYFIYFINGHTLPAHPQITGHAAGGQKYVPYYSSASW